MGLAYCIRCKQKREVVNGKLDYYKNGTPVEKGTCKECSCRVTRILTREERTKLTESQKQFDNVPADSKEDKE